MELVARHRFLKRSYSRIEVVIALEMLDQSEAVDRFCVATESPSGSLSILGGENRRGRPAIDEAIATPRDAIEFGEPLTIDGPQERERRQIVLALTFKDLCGVRHQRSRIRKDADVHLLEHDGSVVGVDHGCPVDIARMHRPKWCDWTQAKAFGRQAFQLFPSHRISGPPHRQRLEASLHRQRSPKCDVCRS